MTIAYPNFEGLGDWEPAKRIMVNDYDWTDINTNQIDVIVTIKTKLIQILQINPYQVFNISNVIVGNIKRLKV